MFLFAAPTSWSCKPITFQENKPASSWMQSRTMHFHYCKYWTGIVPYCLNDIFMPSLNNYNTRWHWIYHFVEQIKDTKVCHFLVQRSGICYAQTWKQLQLQLLSRIAWKKKFLKNCNSEQLYWFLLIVDFFFFRGILMEIRTVLDLF